MTEYDYSPEAFALHAARLYGWSDYYRQPDWLSVDPTNRNAVRGIEPATGPPDSELSAMTDLRRSERSHSLLTLLKIIYWDYAAGHPDALFRVSQRVPREEARPHFGITRGLNKETASRLKQIFRCYEVPFSERPLSSSTARERICVARKAGIIRICEACYRLGANIDVGGLVRQDLALTHEIGNLNARCQRLEYLFRTGRACPRNRARVEKLIESIKMSSALNDIELLRNRESFSDLYFKFCELTLMGEDTGATIRDLRNLVKDELELANHRVEEFNALRKHYEDGGRRDLVVLMQENTKAGAVKKFLFWEISEEFPITR